MYQIYIEYHFIMFPLKPTSEILVAQLGELGFESFTETETGLKAYIQKKELDPVLINDIQVLNSLEFEISYKVAEIPQVNWNAEWEKNFNPIEVNGECALRAPFHPPFNVKYEIIIEPKMSFGTGHHETTFMMLQFILENDFKEKSVIDMGCGTAVLAILSEMKGAYIMGNTRGTYIYGELWITENTCVSVQKLLFLKKRRVVTKKEGGG